MVEKKLFEWLGAVASFSLLIIAWAVFSMLFNSFIFPSPIEVAKTFFEFFLSGEIYPHIFATLKRAIVGFFLGLIFGCVLGYLTGMIKWVNILVKPIVELVRPIPPITWTPLAILWFGIGDVSAFFIIFIASFFPVFTNVQFGVNSLPIVCDRVSKNCSLSFSQRFVHIIFPFSLPHLMVGCRTAIGWAWMCIISAEIIASSQGLGYLIEIGRFTLQPDRIIAIMLIVGIIGLVLQNVLRVMEIKLTSWRSVSNE